jgi:transcription termination/antitermination protein NusA
VRAYIYDVREEPRGPQIFLSRTHPQFMAKLFAQEVPEIYDGIIEIKAVARDPGSRAKIAVMSTTARSTRSAPASACAAAACRRWWRAAGREDRHHSLVAGPATFVVNALAPAEVTKVVLDEDARRIEVVVPDDQLSLAIGRRGQNVRLASQLTGWDIDILTEAEESERRRRSSAPARSLFIEALDVDDVIAHLLVTEGFTSVEEVAFVPIEDLARSRASTRRSPRSCLADLAADELRFACSGQRGEHTLEAMARLPNSEVDRILQASPIGQDEANAIIMAARAHWFDDEPAAEDAPEEETGAETGAESGAEAQH